ncbi:DSBA oxidoreductase [Nitratireductor aestuarii]|uniref:DSBA oxidoreductase n=1 Tax=Nitratireductor aestuarii TaxID=1735103 RepID=A0A916RHA0_9HYPH|nr:DsbA family protein [Nitratireductor aestuarii]GGA53831.1 DSBA oxidoreductase [Nitratireductor aestuarii]
MKNTLRAGIAAAILAATSLNFSAALANDEKSNFSRAEIETIVREYLIKNPEVMLEVQASLQAKQQEAQKKAAQEAIALVGDEIFNSEADGIIGNPEGDVTIVEFFDYNCGFCKRAISDMDNLVKQDPNLRFVLKEFPILSEDSHKAATVSMAVHMIAPDKYAEFHRTLLGAQERATEESAVKVALNLGIDETALRNKMQDPTINDRFRSTYALAEQLQITGTPGYVVGQEIVSGAMGEQVLREKIAAARK